MLPLYQESQAPVQKQPLTLAPTTVTNSFSYKNAYLLMRFRLMVHMKTKTNGEKKNASKSRHFHTETDKCGQVKTN